MNTTNEQLLELLKYLTETIKSAGDFTKNNAPSYFNELLTYELMANSMLISLGLILLVVSFFIIKWYRREEKTRSQEALDVLLGFILAGCILYNITITTTSIFDIVKIKMAPKVYILDVIMKKFK